MSVPTPSHTGSPVSDRQPDPRQREDQAEQRAQVLQQHHRQLRALRLPDELPPATAPLIRSLHDAVRSEKLSSTIATHQDGDRDGGESSSSWRARSFSMPS